MVETAAYVLGAGSDGTVRFLDLRDSPKTSVAIRAAFDECPWNEIGCDFFRALPHSQFLYDISDDDAESLTSESRIEPTLAE